MPRGRLIFPMFCEIAPFDTEAVKTADDYDDDYRETVKRDTDGDGLGEEVEHLKDVVTIKAQIEHDREEMQRMARGGDIPDSAIGLVVHMRDFERDGLVNADGSLVIRKNDRLQRILDKRGNPVNTFDPNLVCFHAKRIQADIGSTSNNALLVFGDRPVGLT